MTHPLEGATARVVVLGIGDETFAIDAAIVREILDPVPVTPVPGARPDVGGIVNMRGNVIPLADLRVRFGMPVCKPTADTRFIVLDIAGEGASAPLVVAIVADRVFEVADITPQPGNSIPRIGMAWPPELVSGVARWNGDLIILPDIAATLN